MNSARAFREDEYFGCYFRWRGVIRVLKKSCELLRFPASPICFLSLYFCPFACFFFFLHTCFSPCGATASSSTPSFSLCKFNIIPPICFVFLLHHNFTYQCLIKATYLKGQLRPNPMFTFMFLCFHSLIHWSV